MQKNTDKQINDILNSFKGGQRAQPPDDLFIRIEQAIYKQDALVIPMNRLSIIAVAASVMLLMNLFVINHYLNPAKNQELVEYNSMTPLITDFNLYNE